MQSPSNRIQALSGSTASVVAGLVRFITALGLGALALSALGAWAKALWTGVAAPGPATADEVLLAGVVALAVVLGGWLWVGVVLEGLSLLPGWMGRSVAPIARAVTPRLARRAVALTLGAGLVTGIGAVAQAAPPRKSSAISVVNDSVAATPVSAARVDSTQAASMPQPPSAGWRATPPSVRPQAGPDLRATSARTSPTPAWTPSRAGGGQQPGHVVVRGDSLWSIAATALGPGATDDEIAAEWPRWYAANVTTIGPDPNVIRPGQILNAPGGDSR